MSIVYYKNIKGLSLSQIAAKSSDYDPSTGEGTKVEEAILINGNKGFRLVSCCYGGETDSYYFLTNGNKNFVNIIIYSQGPDRQKFNEIAKRIVSTVEFIK